MPRERLGSGTFSSSVPSSPRADMLLAPPLVRRMACWLYEGMLLFAVVFVSGWLFSTLLQVRNPADARRPLLQAFVFVVFGIYFAWFWAKGQTVAMKTWKIRVVDRNGQPLSQTRALLRYACSWLWFLPPLALMAPFHPRPVDAIALVLAWVAAWALASRLHPQRQFWHDALAGTRLVSARAASRDNPVLSVKHNAAMSLPPDAVSPANQQKLRRGLDRVLHATGYSLAGLRAGWGETAFRQEAIASIALLPLAFWLGRNWIEIALLAGSVLIVMMVELLNTGIETAIDRIGPEWHDLSKRAKDMGSAAVLLSLVLCSGIWVAALYQRFAA